MLQSNIYHPASFLTIYRAILSQSLIGGVYPVGCGISKGPVAAAGEEGALLTAATGPLML